MQRPEKDFESFCAQFDQAEKESAVDKLVAHTTKQGEKNLQIDIEKLQAAHNSAVP